jgi:hypothetical protein
VLEQQSLKTKSILSLVILAASAFAGDNAPNRLSPEEQAEGFVLLFNGKDLNGWKGDEKLWSVSDNAIVGSSDGQTIDHNTFLYTEETYSDFVLKAEIRLRNGNTGIQFRSKAFPDWVVKGYQADASYAGERSAWGNFYEEKGRGRNVMKTIDEGWQKAKDLLRVGDWNEYEILAQGSRIRLTFNGRVTIDTEDHESPTGVIAFQLHTGDPMKVEFRNIKLKPLR